MPPLNSARMACAFPTSSQAKRLRNREACPQSRVAAGARRFSHAQSAPGAATSCTIRLFGPASSLAPCMSRTRHIGPLHTKLQYSVAGLRGDPSFAVPELLPGCSVRCPTHCTLTGLVTGAAIPTRQPCFEFALTGQLNTCLTSYFHHHILSALPPPGLEPAAPAQ